MGQKALLGLNSQHRPQAMALRARAIPSRCFRLSCSRIFSRRDCFRYPHQRLKLDERDARVSASYLLARPKALRVLAGLSH